MASKSVYKIVFHNDGKLYEIFAREVNGSHLLGFVEVEGLLFGEKTTVVVDPSEEHLRSEFAGVERTYLPMHAIVRIDHVAKRGTAKITSLPGGGEKVRQLPTPTFVPPKSKS